MEGFILIFSLILVILKKLWKRQKLKKSSRKSPVYHNQMAHVKEIYELIEVSSESENEEKPERASTPLPKDAFPNIRVILELSHSPSKLTPT